MGCGGSTHQAGPSDAGAQPTKVKEEEPKQTEEKKQVESTAVEVKSPVGSKDPQDADNQDKGKRQNAAVEQNASPAPDIVTGREKYFPSPIMKEVKGDDKKYYLVCVHGDLSDLLHGLTVVTRSDAGSINAVVWSDAEILQFKNKKAEKLAIPAFWKAFASSVSKGDLKITKEGSRVEFSLKSTSITAELTSQGAGNDAMFTFITQPLVFFYRAKNKPAEPEKEEERAKVLKKEALLNTYEATIYTFDTKRDEAEGRLAPLRSEARGLRERVQYLENKVTQMKSQIEQIKNGGITELDKMYACKSTVTKPEELKELPMEKWASWDFDSSILNGTPLANVAWTLFQHYELVSKFEIDPVRFESFWAAIERGCRDNPFHNANRAIEVMLAMHCVITTLGFGKFEGKEDGIITLHPEDLLASFIAAGIIDIDNPGLDNTCLVRGKDFLSTLYSDLFILEQNRLTYMFELLENDCYNVLHTLDTDQEKDVRDTIVEVLFMKANAKMQTMSEKLAEFKEKLALFDWTRKDDVRLALTMALRIADISIWAREQGIHKERLQVLVEEFYLQGDLEISRGFQASPFMESCWTADRNKHRQDFPLGQVQIIDTVVMPILETMQQILPEFGMLIELADANKKYWISENEERQQKEQGRAPLMTALAELPKCFSATEDRSAVIATLPHAGESKLYVMACTKDDVYFSTYDEDKLEALGGDAVTMVQHVHEQLAEDVTGTFEGGVAVLDVGGKQLEVEKAGGDQYVLFQKVCSSFMKFRNLTKERDVDGELEENNKAAGKIRPVLANYEDEYKVYTHCITSCKDKETTLMKEEQRLNQELTSLGGSAATEDDIVACVRNPLAAPMPVGVERVPDCRDIDEEIFKIVKSAYEPWEEGVAFDKEKHIFANVIRPYTTSEFAEVTASLADEKRTAIWKLIQDIDEWDYDVFALQKEMSGSYTHEGLANQPNGGSLFLTCYALFYKYGLMKKLNLNEWVVINWLSIVEAGYHPNPYHNSMHAADVLHVSHYILKKGKLIEKCKVSDEDVFCTLFAACVHDYNHPGINNAFHVKTQNYLAVLFNDRSVNENVHTSCVFELMRLDRFNILSGFDATKRAELREVIVELVLGTDMGLHAQILTRFKKKLEVSSRIQSREDMKLALTMCVKMADISNCGRPQKLYHGWCHQIADEFFMQGDRERLMGLVVSPFMDRYTTVMSKGQTAFMNYIVVPLFECMAEFLPNMSHATELTEQNKYFWQEHEDW